MSILGFSFSHLLVTIFSGDESSGFEEACAKANQLYFLLFIAAGPNFVLSAYLQSTRKVFMSILINLMKSFGFVWIFLMILPEYFNLGLDGIWLSRAFAEVSALLLILFISLYDRSRYYSDQSILRG